MQQIFAKLIKVRTFVPKSCGMLIINKDTCRDYLQQRLQDDVAVRPLRLRKAFKALGRAFLRVHSDTFKTDHIPMRKAGDISHFPSQVSPILSFLSGNRPRDCIEDNERAEWQRKAVKKRSAKKLGAKKPRRGRSRSSYAPSRLRKVMRKRRGSGPVQGSAERYRRARIAQHGRATLPGVSRI